MSLKLIISSLVGFIVLTMPLLASTIAAHEPSKMKTEASRRVTSNVKMPRFTLIDQQGKLFDAENKLRGKIVAINFIYTTCSDVCPLFTIEFARLQEALRRQAQLNSFLVSITTDPEIDSPKVLESYARRFGADFQNWAFLTGDELGLKDVWKSFGVQVIRRDRGLLQHTYLTTLVDAQGIRRINFLGPQWQFNDFLKDMRALSPNPP